MPALDKLSAAKLHAEIAKRDARHSALLSEVIAAGYGETRINDMYRIAAEQGYPLVVEYVAACEAQREAACELDARRRYHGGDKPIKRMA